jgi:peptide/nickel transport system substrate-binding protein
VLLVSCGTKQQADIDYDRATDTIPAPGDWAVVHSLSDPDFLNPIISRGADASEIEGHVFEALMDMEPDSLKLIPYIAAEHPVISVDKKEYTYKLRHDVTFSDGRPLTGADVLFTMKIIKNRFVDCAPLAGYYSSIQNVVLTDSFTVTFKCEQPYFKNDEMIGGLSVFPKHYYDPAGLTDSFTLADLADTNKCKKIAAIQRFGEEFNKSERNRAPVGSGPYVFEKWESNQQIVLKRNESWWKKSDVRSPNYVDKIVFRVANDMDAALVALKNGNFDVLFLKPNQYVNQTATPKFNAMFRKNTNVTPGYTYIGWNQARPFFQDKKVRWALSHLTDVDKIIKVVNLGFAVRTTGPVFYKRPEYDATLAPVPYDPAKAQALLDEAGWKDTDGDGVREKTINGKPVEFEFTFLINSGNDLRKQTGLILCEELKKYGIKAGMQELEWSVFLQNIQTHQYDATILGWAMSTLKDDPYQIWHSSQIADKGSNSIGYRSAQVDKIIEEIRSNFDEARYTALMSQFQKIIYDDQPYTFLYSGQALPAIHKRFRQVKLYPYRPGYNLHEWGVGKSLQKYVQ